MPIEFHRAQRKAVPMIMSIAGPSGAGKTYSALLMAAGLAGEDGRVGLIDTENGRGEMYQDSPGIIKALPNSFRYTRFDPPFSPARYIEYIAAAEKVGITVGVIDSGTHEWEGIGGCTDIAETQKLGRMPNWAKAKMEHKKFVNHLLSSGIHWIICLRARDKVKVFKRGDAMILSATDIDSAPLTAEKDCIVPIGLSAVAEKSFVFEMLLSLMLDERTHNAVPLKVPEPLQQVFAGKHLITREDGDRIRQWNDTGAVSDQWEPTRKRARATAEEGVVAYKAFCDSLTAPAKKAMGKPLYDELMARAVEVDALTQAATEEAGVADSPTDAPETQGGANVGQESIL